MADTINVPGLGPTKSVYVYAGGALVLGIVGYAWWKNAQSSAPTDYVGADPDDFGVTDYDSPLGNSGTNSTGSYSAVDPGAIDTNGEWTLAAHEYLTNTGYSSVAVLTALGKYLARQGLTEEQVNIVQGAIAAFGPPPVGGPYPITNALPGEPDPDPDPDPEPSQEFHPVKQGWNVSNVINTLRVMHPTYGLSEDKLASLNPGWPERYVSWAKDKVGFVSPETPGAERVFGSSFNLRIK